MKYDEMTFNKVTDEDMLNRRTATILKQNLEQFKAQAAQRYGSRAAVSFDVSISNGKIVILSRGLADSLLSRIQEALDDPNNPPGFGLKAAIAVYNDAAVRMVNMNIKKAQHLSHQEHGKQGLLTIDQFTDGISYDWVAASNGHYSHQKHVELITSSGRVDESQMSRRLKG